MPWASEIEYRFVHLPRIGTTAKTRGTGFLIDSDRVLTAAHIAGQSDRRSVLRYCPETKKMKSVSAGVQRFDGFDVAILRLDKPVPFELPKAQVAQQPPRFGARWHSRGAVDEASLEDKFGGSMFPFSGTTEYCGFNEESLHLVVTDHPDKQSCWFGISGSPVLQPDSLEISGVLRGGRKDRRMRQLATPLWRLCRDPVFLEALGASSLDERLQKLQESLKTELELIPDELPTLTGTNAPTLDSAVAILVAGDPSDAMWRVATAYRKALKDSKIDVAASLERVLWLLGPAVVTPQWADSLGPGEGQRIVMLKANTEALVELILAGWDGRESAWRPPRTPLDGQDSRAVSEFRGMGQIPTKGRYGLFSAESVGLRSLAQYFWSQYLSDFSEEKIASDERALKVLEAANGHLSDLADDERGDRIHRYLVYSSAVAAQQSAWLPTLQESLKAVHFVQAEGDQDSARTHSALIRPAMSLLEWKHGLKEP